MHPRDIIDRPAPARLICSDCFEPATLTDREMPLCLVHAAALGIVSEADKPFDPEDFAFDDPEDPNA